MKISQLVQAVVVSLVVILLPIAPAFGQDKKDTAKTPAAETAVPPMPTSVTFSGAGLGAGLGMALTIVGAAYGMGKIGAAALEGMARQPEVAPSIQTAMIIIAAMLEGATLASVALCFVVGLNARF